MELCVLIPDENLNNSDIMKHGAIQHRKKAGHMIAKRSTNRVLAGLATGLVMTGVAAPVHAAVETESVSYPTLEVNTSETLTFQPFDPSLGTLTDIFIRIVSNDTVESVVYNPSPSTIGSYTGATATTPLTVTTLAGLSGSTTLQAGPANGTAAPNSFVVAASQSGMVTSETHVPSSDFSQYTGSSLISFDVGLSQGMGMYSGSYSSPSALLFFGGNASSFGELDFQFTYVAVPECGVLVAGLAALGACAFPAAWRAFRQRRFSRGLA